MCTSVHGEVVCVLSVHGEVVCVLSVHGWDNVGILHQS